MKWLAKLLGLAALIGGVSLFAPAVQAAGICPTINSATTCNLFITINPDGSVTLTAGDPDPYDGVEDTLIGVTNNFAGAISTLHISGSNIFGFDGDGACTLLGGGGCGPTGYEGPGTSFSPVNNSDGFVNFTGGLAGGGGTAWFSLEELLNAGNTVVTIPEPGTLALLGLAATAFGFSRRRKS